MLQPVKKCGGRQEANGPEFYLRDPLRRLAIRLTTYILATGRRRIMTGNDLTLGMSHRMLLATLPGTKTSHAGRTEDRRASEPLTTMQAVFKSSH